MSGKEMFKTRYSFDWILLKSIQFLFKKPYICGALFFIYGYLQAFIMREEKVVTKALGKFIRKQKRKALLSKITGPC